MLWAIRYLQIVLSVITPVLVAVMNDVVRPELAARNPLANNAMRVSTADFRVRLSRFYLIGAETIP